MFKDRLYDAMCIREMKAAELCRRTGINKSTISNYLSGRMEPKSKKIYDIAKALDVSEAWLIGYDVAMEKPKDKEDVKADILKLYEQLTDEQKTVVLRLCETLIGKS